MSKLKALRKRIPLSTTVILLLLVIIQVSVIGTLAYLNDYKKVDNPMNPGFLNDFVIKEDFEKPDPGDTVTDKKVWVENGSKSSSIPIYARMAIVPVFRVPGGDSLAGSVSFDGDKMLVTSPDGATQYECIFHNQWKNNWFYKDGFFYHKEIVAKGGQSSQLLSEVKIVSSTSPNPWNNFEIEVLAEATQTDGNVTEALAIWNVSKGSDNKLVP